jgi:hypothetical protein
MKRPQRPGTHLLPAATPSPEPDRLSVPDIGTDLAEKADTAMYEDNEDRMSAAEQLAEHNPHAAVEAFSAIACNQAVGDEVRLSAAEQLAALDSSA